MAAICTTCCVHKCGMRYHTLIPILLVSLSSLAFHFTSILSLMLFLVLLIPITTIFSIFHSTRILNSFHCYRALISSSCCHPPAKKRRQPAQLKVVFGPLSMSLVVDLMDSPSRPVCVTSTTIVPPRRLIMLVQ